MALVGCASSPTSTADANGEVYDPIEPVNRVFFDFNLFLDKNLLRPVTRVYVDVVPEAFRVALHNILEALATPLVMTHELLQGDVDRFMHSAARLTVNIAGGAGVLDVAGEEAPFLDEDFGQTLAVWGAPSGPYLVLPFFGPSNIRDAVGLAGDSLADPTGRLLQAREPDRVAYFYSGSKLAATVLDKRSRTLGQIEELEKTSLDFYATIRSLYDQKRRAEIRNGATDEPLPIPEISFERDDSPKTPKASKASYRPR